MSINFANPLFFLLLAFLIPMVLFYRKQNPSIVFSSLVTLKKQKKTFSSYLVHLPFFFKLLAFIFMVIALSRPQTGRTKTERKTEGLDMMLVVDTSGSMQALDFKIDGERRDRLYVIKKVVTDFIEKRLDDRLGMIVFGTHAYAQAPLTLDHDILKEYLDGATIGMAGESTAIGDALGLAISSLKDIKSKNKIIVLLTDGANTAGKLDPLQVMGAAKELKIKIYSIGVGSSGYVPVPGPFGLQKVKFELDETLLKKMAKETGGVYFRAKSTEGLVDVYKTIDSLEKTEVKIASYHNYDEKFMSFLWVSFYCLIIFSLLSASRFRRVP